MGNSRQSKYWQPDPPPPTPVYVPQFDPMLGFPEGRKERVVKTTVEEMEIAQIPPQYRDYCIDKYMDLLRCKREVFPLVYKCKHVVHAYHDCQYEDLVLRMKEDERERRLAKKFDQPFLKMNGEHTAYKVEA